MRRLVPVALLASLLAAAPVARGADGAPSPGAVESARHHFTRGIGFYQGGDFASALVEFRAAYDAAPNYRVLFNVSRTCESLGDYTCAVSNMKRFLAEGRDLTHARRAQGEADVKRLEGHVATLTLDVSEPGASLTATSDRVVDLGSSPLAEPVTLNGGSWTLKATKAGFDDAQETVSVAGGDRRAVKLVLSPHQGGVASVGPPAPVPVAPPSSAESSPSPSASAPHTVFWIGIAGAGALAVGATVTGILAVGAHSDYASAVGRFGATSSEIESDRSKTRDLALATDILGGAAIGVAAATIALRLWGPGSHAAAETGVSVAPAVGRGTAGLSITTRF